MSLDLNLLGSKLRRVREQLSASVAEVSNRTGIAPGRLKNFEEGNLAPSGDEILILADHYRYDYQFFISNDQQTAFEQTEMLFRRHGDDFSVSDRRAVQDFLYLCECEHDLLSMNRQVKAKRLRLNADLSPREQAARAAQSLRRIPWSLLQ